MPNKYNDIILDALTTLTTDYAPLKGKEFYNSICKYIVKNFDIDICFVGRISNYSKSLVNVLAGCSNEGTLECFEYDLKDTPCENAINNQHALYVDNLEKLFPDDQMLKELKIKSYAGIALIDKEQKPLGILVAVSKCRFQDPKKIEKMLRVYVGSLSAEMERFNYEQNEKDLKKVAYFDPLTNLPNRLLITDKINTAILNAVRKKSIVAVCFIDLDGFKNVNDSLGHEAGDFILIETANRLKSFVRPEDTVARLGGDEFVIILSDLENTNDVSRILSRILKSISQSYHYQNNNIETISASIGVTLFPEDDVNSDTLLRHSDQAMYKAKESGKNQFCFYNVKEQNKMKANINALKKIEEALKNDEFEIYFQPKLKAKSKRIESVEVLSRWNHSILGLLSPDEFLPLIEKDELIYIFDSWVMKESFKKLKLLIDKGLKINFSINISSKQFRERTFSSKVFTILDDLNMPYDILKFVQFEITESSALESINHTNNIIEQLKSKGATFALDDFGTGYSSLVHLKELKIDTVKIDKSFIIDMIDNPHDLAITNAVISLSKVFNIEVVAEGVETVDSLLYLLKLDCDTFQGYYISKALCFDDLVEYLNGFCIDSDWKFGKKVKL